MKTRIFLSLLLLSLLIPACSRPQDAVAIRIGNIKVSRSEFEEAFQRSRFAKTEGGRKAFLDIFIDKKLILKEAEDMGLDKEPEFLSEIQLFWERELIRTIMSRKSDELAAGIKIPDEKVRKYYKANRETLFAGKELADIYEQVKWYIIQDEQGQAMKEWARSLKEHAEIEVNYEPIGY